MTNCTCPGLLVLWHASLQTKKLLLSASNSTSTGSLLVICIFLLFMALARWPHFLRPLLRNLIHFLKKNVHLPNSSNHQFTYEVNTRLLPNSNSMPLSLAYNFISALTIGECKLFGFEDKVSVVYFIRKMVLFLSPGRQNRNWQGRHLLIKLWTKYNNNQTVAPSIILLVIVVYLNLHSPIAAVFLRVLSFRPLGDRNRERRKELA